jgi:hypothetical protein
VDVDAWASWKAFHTARWAVDHGVRYEGRSPQWSTRRCRYPGQRGNIMEAVRELGFRELAASR